MAIIYLKMGLVYDIIVAGAYWKEGNGFAGWQFGRVTSLRVHFRAASGVDE